MKKIHRHPGPLTSGPPSSHAAVAPIPPSAPQIPIALLRSESSVKVVTMIDKAVGVMTAAPMPWTTRAISSATAEPAKPHVSEPTVNSSTPARNTRRRPSRSAARPPEQQQTAVGERVRTDDPWQVILGEVQVRADLR
jgi:hypothetical protein